MSWTVYILECSDKTLYTGITTDLKKRLAKHLQGTGAKYLRGRGPYKVIHTERYATRGAALKRESEIKALRKVEKLALAQPEEIHKRT